MGEDVAASVFTREDRQRYRQKVKRSLGLEIELNLTDERGDPALLNAPVLESIASADFQTELARFNVEINVPPRLLDGGVLSELERDVRQSLNCAEERSRTVGAHMVLT